MVSTGAGARLESISLLARVKEIDKRNGNVILSILIMTLILEYIFVHFYVILHYEDMKDDMLSMVDSSFFIIYIMLSIWLEDIASALNMYLHKRVIRERTKTN